MLRTAPTWPARAARALAVASCAAVLVFGVAAQAARADDLPPHVAFTKDTSSCGMCHRAHSAPAGGSWTLRTSSGATVTVPTLTIISAGGKGDTGLCLSCHGPGDLGSTEDVGTEFSQGQRPSPF